MTPKEKEELQVKLTMKNADMIMSAVKMAKTLSQMSGCGPEGIMTTMVFVVGDFIPAMAADCGVPKERIMNDLLDAIRDYVNDNKNKQGN